MWLRSESKQLYGYKNMTVPYLYTCRVNRPPMLVPFRQLVFSSSVQEHHKSPANTFMKFLSGQAHFRNFNLKAIELWLVVMVLLKFYMAVLS